MNEENGHESYVALQRRAKRLKLAASIMGTTIFVAAVIVGVFLLIHSRHKPARVTQVNPLTELAQTVSFPIYYPSSLPTGFQYDPNSVSTQGGILNFVLSYEGGKQLSVTEQPLPKAIEQVTEITKFSTPIGKTAYIANLNGQTAGFIQTKSTLLIFSNWQGNNTTMLQQLMTNMKPVSS